MSAVEYSMAALTGGLSQKIATSTVSAASGELTCSYAVVTSDADCFFRQGSAPTAVADGTDQFLPAGVPFRIYGITNNNKLAFINASGTGNVYLSPNA